MDIGMLWFDNDPRTKLNLKIDRAADHYRQKYGVTPNLCVVHPSMLDEHTGLIEGHAGKISVISDRTVLEGHLWIGKDDNT